MGHTFRKKRQVPGGRRYAPLCGCQAGHPSTGKPPTALVGRRHEVTGTLLEIVDAARGVRGL
ncbi:MAG: hypothetical protein ABI242_07295, partial [Caulobacteraceae bacterium]